MEVAVVRNRKGAIEEESQRDDVILCIFINSIPQRTAVILVTLQLLRFEIPKANPEQIETYRLED